MRQYFWILPGRVAWSSCQSCLAGLNPGCPRWSDHPPFLDQVPKYNRLAKAGIPDRSPGSRLLYLVGCLPLPGLGQVIKLQEDTPGFPPHALSRLPVTRDFR